MSASLDLFRFASLAALDGVVHAISTRQGGVSEGRCATLNTSHTVGDDEDRVEENLRRLAVAVGTERSAIRSPYQVHGREAVVVDGSTEGGARPRCDVLLTADPRVALLLRYADCTPVLLADPVRRAVAVAHAGWRGTAVGAAAAAVQALAGAFGSRPSDLYAGVGPAIGPCCYEVGQEVVDTFADRPWAIQRTAAGRTHLDLWEANRRALVEAGVPAAQVEVAGICTRCHADRFFSHRANGGQPAGRFAAVMRLAD